MCIHGALQWTGNQSRMYSCLVLSVWVIGSGSMATLIKWLLKMNEGRNKWISPFLAIFHALLIHENHHLLLKVLTQQKTNIIKDDILLTIQILILWRYIYMHNISYLKQGRTLIGILKSKHWKIKHTEGINKNYNG